MKYNIIGLLILASTSSLAAESWVVEGKTYSDKASAVKAVISAGHPVTIEHTRTEILTNGLTFKAAPKAPKDKVAKAKIFKNEQFSGLNKSE